MIYLDNSATAPIDEEVRDAMLPYLNEEFGNPSSKYYCKATHAKNAVEEAREKVAKLLGANPDEIIFTAGATESTNFIIKGYLDYRKFYGDGKNHVITSLVEHKATLKGGWEFPGGKIEAGETPQEALKREIMEELDTEVSVGEWIETVEYDYPGFHLSMDCFWCEIVKGDLVLKEHEAARWLTREELTDVEWLPADVAVAEKIEEEMD